MNKLIVLISWTSNSVIYDLHYFQILPKSAINIRQLCDCYALPSTKPNFHFDESCFWTFFEASVGSCFWGEDKIRSPAFNLKCEITTVLVVVIATYINHGFNILMWHISGPRRSSGGPSVFGVRTSREGTRDGTQCQTLEWKLSQKIFPRYAARNRIP